MAHVEQREFCSSIRDRYPEYFVGKKVLDIGSLDINGNNRFLFTDCNYLGLDVGEGSNVDIVGVGHLFEGPDEYYDTIISTEVFEHDMFYEETVKNIMRMLKPGGAFIFTCAADGRPEHGTRRCGEHCAPLLIQISEQWADYYKNLMEHHFLRIEGFKEMFPDGFFIYNNKAEIPADLYFFGVKGGIENTRKFIPKNSNSILSGGYDVSGDIFVLGAWPDTSEKESDLIGTINKLKEFHGIPILLISHYPIKSEIQKMVDYYIYDANNDIVKNEDFDTYGISSDRWTQMGEYRVVNKTPYHHDYAIWTSMKQAASFCKFLGKKTVHYLEYDNLIDTFQYRQAFLEMTRVHDAVVYEYNPGSIHESLPYIATYIFSIKLDIFQNILNEINTKEEYFSLNKSNWQLERVFINKLKKFTSNIGVSKYVANDNELNRQAVWNRDGILRGDGKFQVYLAVNNKNKLFVHLISGFDQNPAEKDYLLEIKYGQDVFFENLEINDYRLIELGDYCRGKEVIVKYMGRTVFNKFIDEYVDDFKHMNYVFHKDDTMVENKLNINFVDGPFVEVTGEIKGRYNIKFIDSDTNEEVFSTNIKNNEWARCSRRWFTNWKILIKSENGREFEYKFDLNGKRVFIVFESSSLGDTLAWIPYVEEFRKKHGCQVLVSTFQNNLFKEQYPNLEFVEPGVTVYDLYALYRLGCFYDENSVDLFKHKTDFTKLRLQEYASDILGIDFKEILPLMPKVKPMKSEKPYICIANHSTAQSKYWNNPTGWQELVDYVKSLGYDVYLLSREDDGYMGNINPKGVIQVKNKTLTEIGSILLGSECFVGISSGLSWLAWSFGIKTVLISGQTDKLLEPSTNIERVINESVCHACFSRHLFDKGDWNWCPDHKETPRQFECSKSISFDMVKPHLNKILGI